MQNRGVTELWISRNDPNGPDYGQLCRGRLFAVATHGSHYSRDQRNPRISIFSKTAQVRIHLLRDVWARSEKPRSSIFSEATHVGAESGVHPVEEFPVEICVRPIELSRLSTGDQVANDVSRD